MVMGIERGFGFLWCGGFGLGWEEELVLCVLGVVVWCSFCGFLWLLR